MVGTVISLGGAHDSEQVLVEDRANTGLDRTVTQCSTVLLCCDFNFPTMRSASCLAARQGIVPFADPPPDHNAFAALIEARGLE